MDKYTIPKGKPEYPYVKEKKKKKSHFYLALDGIFSAYGLILTFAFAIALLLSGLVFSWASLFLILAFWIILTYVALPRFHSLLSMMYLPDYFIFRTKTGDGLLGDPINLAIRGSEEDIHAAMRRSGWTEADPITFRSSYGIVMSSIKKKSYDAAPVSSLYLFDRKQNFAYQEEYDGNASQRHHIRFWKVPEGWTLPGGVKADWLAAATFDTGVGLRKSTLQFTHRIDADTDKERDYVIDTVLYKDHDSTVDVVSQFTSPYHDINGGGDEIYTDGNMPILDVTGAKKRADEAGIDLTQEDTLDVPKNIKALNKELPPTSLNFVGLFVVLKIIATVVLTILVFMSGDPGVTVTNESLFEIIGLFLDCGIEFVLYLLIINKKKWSRLGFLIITSISATAQMIETFRPLKPSISSIIITGMTVITVLILSSPAVKKWVYDVPHRGNGPAVKTAEAAK